MSITSVKPVYTVSVISSLLSSHFNHLQGKPTQLELTLFSTATPDEAKCYVQSSIEFRVLKLEFRALTE